MTLTHVLSVAWSDSPCSSSGTDPVAVATDHSHPSPDGELRLCCTPALGGGGDGSYHHVVVLEGDE